jgi:hypothetical protein
LRCRMGLNRVRRRPTPPLYAKLYLKRLADCRKR